MANLEELREKYPPQKYETQVEFERVMTQMNEEQTHINHPFIDREMELAKQRKILETQKQSINIQLNQIKLESIELEQKRKDINRVFYDLKHELLEANPREDFARKEEGAA